MASSKKGKFNRQKWRGVIHIVVVLALGCVLLLNRSQVQAGTPDDSYTIERYYTESLAESTWSTDTSFQDKVTLTFIPPATKNYLIVASALVTNGSTSYYTEVKLVIDGTDYGINQFQPSGAGADNYVTFFDGIVQQLDNTSHTVKISYRTNNTAGAAYIKNAAISIIEASNYNFGDDTTSTFQTNSTSYVTEVTLGPFSPVLNED